MATTGAGADLQGGLGGLQPPLQLLQPWISEVGDEEEEVEERRKWREGEEEEEISPPLIHFPDPPLVTPILIHLDFKIKHRWSTKIFIAMGEVVVA